MRPPKVRVIPRAGLLQKNRANRWGVILAGGDGMRLRPLTRFICGDDRPKQFCPLFAGQTLLGQTLQRSLRTISREQLIVSLTAHHRQWYSSEPGLHSSQLVVQPENKGTAPPILHSILSLAKVDPNAIVAILPCDHHYANEQTFASVLENAFGIAEQQTDSIVLLGSTPDYPEIEYGWIELGAPVGGEDSDLFRVRSFREKPALDVARRLLEEGSVWNMFVMVGHVQAFLELIEASLPILLNSLTSAPLWTGKETHIQHSLYDRGSSVCFSNGVLSTEPGRQVVLRLNNIGWSDLGDPNRACMAVRDSGCDPGWIHDWGRANGCCAVKSS